jgi:hypothetical protein
MEQRKIKLSWMNDGKEFLLPFMTVKAQEEIMHDIVEIEKKHKKDSYEYVQEINKHIILRALQRVDPSVTLEHIDNMHPDDFVFLITEVNRGGRELTDDDRNFRGEKNLK